MAVSPAGRAGSEESFVVLAEGARFSAVRLGPLLPCAVKVTAAAAAPDCVVLEDADPASVRALRCRFPCAAVLAVVAPAAESRTVIAVLSAGADSCVREIDVRAVAAHVQALFRRSVER